MLEAPESALRFVAGRSREDLDTDELLYFGVAKLRLILESP